MANPWEELQAWIDESEESARARRDRSVVDLMYEGFRRVVDAIDYRYETQPPQVALTAYDAEPARSSETNLHGGLLALGTADPLDTVPTNITFTKGIGKILIVVNAGTDLVGGITVTGTTVDRETGAETGADTDDIVVNGLTVDSTTTDGNGNTVHGFSNAYITSKWFRGSVTISTADLTLTDVDTYHVSFEQVNDLPYYDIETFDANIYTTNVLAEFDAYLYSLNVKSNNRVTIKNIAELHVGTNGATALANQYWRLRRGNIGKAMRGSTDGLWADVFYSSSPAWVEDATIKVWCQYTTPQDAEGDLQAQDAVIDGDLLRVVLASGDISAENATTEGAAIWASALVSGPDGDIEADSVTVSGEAIKVIPASGAIQAQPPVFTTDYKPADGDLECSDVEMTGTALRTALATGAMQAQSSTLSGSASVA